MLTAFLLQVEKTPPASCSLVMSLGLRLLPRGCQTILLEVRGPRVAVVCPPSLQNIIDWAPLFSEDESFCWMDLLCKLQTWVGFFSPSSSCCFIELGIRHICNQTKGKGSWLVRMLAMLGLGCRQSWLHWPTAWLYVHLWCSSRLSRCLW